MNKIIRNKSNGYSVIANHCLRNKNISEKAKGVFAIIMSLPDGWDFSISGLVTICNGGESAIRSAIKELMSFGYCEREVFRDEKTKRIIGWNYTFNESPLIEKPLVENPQVENLDVEIPHEENQVQLSKEESIKDRSKKRNKKEQFFFDFESELFEIFKDRPNIEEKVLKWIDYKFDIKKKGYTTLNWIKSELKYSDYQINEAITKSINREYEGFFPDGIKNLNAQSQPQTMVAPVRARTAEQLEYDRARAENGN